MKTILKFCMVGTILTAGPLWAQSQYQPVAGEAPSAKAALTSEMLKALETAVPMTPQMRAVRNALANSSIHALTLNPDVGLHTDALFSHEIKDPGSITDQDKSGRCWLFAGLNVLRPAVIAKEKMKDFALSQAYEEFYEKLEAANRSLELAIGLRKENVHSRRLDTFLLKLIADGGNWNYVRALVGKYGAVPASVMPDDYAAAHTDELVGLLSARLRKAVLEVRQPKFDSAEAADLQEWKMATLKDVYKILVLCLGQPPTSFEWRYENKDGKITPLEKYTPQSFYKKFLDPDLDRYVSLANYPGQPMNTHLEWAWERILADQPNFEAVNISADEMAEMAAKSILADQPVWFAANSGAEGDKKKGLWLQDIEDQQDLFGIDFSMSKADTLAYDNGKPDHAMVITGVDIRDGKPVKWKVENSWGEKAGDKGWFTIDSRWFSRHVFQVIIDRKFVPEKILAVSKQKTILLPPWDPFTDWNQGK